MKEREKKKTVFKLSKKAILILGNEQYMGEKTCKENVGQLWQENL